MKNAISVTPLPGYITLKIIDAETKTASGLELPDTSQEKPQIGKVLAVGTIAKVEFIKANFDVPNAFEALKMLKFQESVKEGNTVVFRKYTGNPVRIQSEEIQIVEFKDILGVIEYGK